MIRPRTAAFLAVVLLGGGFHAEPTAGQAPAPTAGPGAAVRQIGAVRVSGRSPAVDGRLDEEVWQSAPTLTGFVQKQPDEGRPASEQTGVRIVYDDHALYIGARMHSRDPASIQAPISRRDNGSQAERLLVSLDTYHDRRTAYTFGVTASRSAPRLVSPHATMRRPAPTGLRSGVGGAGHRTRSAGRRRCASRSRQLRFTSGADSGGASTSSACSCHVTRKCSGSLVPRTESARGRRCSGSSTASTGSSRSAESS